MIYGSKIRSVVFIFLLSVNIHCGLVQGFSDVYVGDWQLCVYQLTFTLAKFEIVCLLHKLQVSTFLKSTVLGGLETRKEEILFLFQPIHP